MILKSLTLKNFKSIGEEPQTINFAPITLLFGPNSAGKSTIMKALFYLYEIIANKNVDPTRFEMLPGKQIGGFKSLINGHDLDKEMVISVCFDGHESGELFPDLYENNDIDFYLPRFSEKGSWSLEFTIKYSSLKNAPVVTSYKVGKNGIAIGSIKSSPDGARRSIWFSLEKIYEAAGESLDTGFSEFYEKLEGLLDQQVNYVDDGIEFSLEEFKGVVPELGRLVEAVSTLRDIPEFADCQRVNAFISDIFVTPLEIYVRNFKKSAYIGPLREIPDRNFSPETGNSPGRWCSGLRAWDYLHEDAAIVKAVNSWFSDKNRLCSGYELNLTSYREVLVDSPMTWGLLKVGFNVDDAEILKDYLQNIPVKKRLSFIDSMTRTELQPHDLGVGISQVLPVIVSAVLSGEKLPLCFIEQPELHIHPAFQVILGDLFASSLDVDSKVVRSILMDVLQNKYKSETEISDDNIDTDYEESGRKARSKMSFITAINEDSEFDFSASLSNSYRKQFIIETHSEHLLLRLLKRIRQTTDKELEPSAPTLFASEVSIVYVEPGENSVAIKNIRISNDGEFIDSWPKGFFGERRQELM